MEIMTVKSTIQDHDDDSLNLSLGLPGSNKRAAAEELAEDSRSKSTKCSRSVLITGNNKSSTQQQAVVGWPPIRSYRKNNTHHQTVITAMKKAKTSSSTEYSSSSSVSVVEVSNSGGGGGSYVKVSVDGAPYLRKIDVKVYKSYGELVKALENMFGGVCIGNYSETEGYSGSEYAPTYQDKDGDWMLLGDVPWNMFVCSCKRMRIMKGSEARGLASST
ncbi:hypothetical protein F8388_009383 [Cannabis sativa]|uniref:Auxin-responsive protein n=2 Tax=Cannabis sativa TaxID=3483 RepID=A0A7J6GW15_CANSA|nr:hypothetical protein F8388_009383 [Cannabis sativa]KAF4387134.1 hypothetical protein G4B88_024706 [Cannabis sativa]